MLREVSWEREEKGVTLMNGLYFPSKVGSRRSLRA